MQTPGLITSIFGPVVLVFVLASSLMPLYPGLHFVAAFASFFVCFNSLYDWKKGYVLGFLLGMIWFVTGMLQFFMAFR